MKWQWVRQLTAREKLMLQVLAVVAILTFGTVYGILPLIVASSQLDEQIATSSQTNSRLMAQVRQEQEIETELLAISEKLERLAGQLPTKKELPQFILQLEQAGADSKVQLRNVVLGDPVDKTTHGEIPVNLSLSGDYLALVQFVRQMETMPRHTRVGQWQIMAASGAKLEMVISLVIFVDPQALRDPAGDSLPAGYPIGRANPF